MATTRTRYQPTLNAGFVLAQFAFIALCLWGVTDAILQGIPWWRYLIALPLALGSFYVGLWAIWSMGSDTFSVLPAPVPDGTMCDRGPYRYVCHPMYTAVIGVCFAAVVIDPGVLRLIAWVFLVWVLVEKLKFEEMLLTRRYVEYRIYSRTRKRLLPGIW